MPRIAVNLNDVTEPKPVPVSTYDLTIASVEEGKSKEKQRPQLIVSIGIDQHPEAPNVTHFVSLPSGDDEPRSAQFKALMLKRFLTLFNIPMDSDGGFDTEDFPGAKARAELGLSEPNESGDTYNRLVVPKMRGEASKGAAVPKPPKS